MFQSKLFATILLWKDKQHEICLSTTQKSFSTIFLTKCWNWNDNSPKLNIYIKLVTCPNYIYHPWLSCNNQLATYNKPFPVNSRIKDIRLDYKSLGLFHTQTHNASLIKAPAFSIGNTNKNSSPNCFIKNFVVHNFSWRGVAMNLLRLVAENMSNPKYWCTIPKLTNELQGHIVSTCHYFSGMLEVRYI